jgi:hypothetical protein
LATIGKPHLIDLLLKTSSKPVRQQLILYLGSLGKLTDEEAGLIDDMATDDPETFTEVASESLHQARHPLAVKWMIRQIPAEKHKAYIYSKIGSYSEQAISAGPYLQEGLLQATDEYEKMTAVGSLVEIGYRPAIDTLIDVAAVTNDVELLYQIMLALWSFGDPKALSVIDAHREQHWLPFIRASAKLIGQAIREGEPFLQEPGKSFGYTYTYHFESIYRRTAMRGMARCGASDYPRYVSSEIKKYGYQGAPLTEFAISDRDETTSQEEQTRTPSVALHTPHGWLLGRNGGEFGGELITYRSAADYKVLKRINIADFFTINDKVIALAHPIDLSPRESYLLELQYNGEWIIRKVARTPFWVRGAVLINETELFLYDFVEGVGFIMDDQYRFQAAECQE